jgi:dephospho-CoA kinase
MEYDKVHGDFVFGRTSIGVRRNIEYPAREGAPLIAVTGGVGCGKSRLGQLLEQLGAEVVDSDAIVHALLSAEGKLSRVIAQEFGAKYLNPDNSVNRRVLADLVFTCDESRARLNAIVHPEVRASLLNWQTKPTEAWAKVALLPLLFEVGWEGDWHCVVCVSCSEATQRERLAQRSWSAVEINNRIKSQWATADKAARAHIVVENNGSLSELAEAAKVLRNIISRV